MSTAPTARPSYFVIDYSPGPQAPPGAPVRHDTLSALRAHLEHLRAGHQAGLVVMAGPWTGQLTSGFVVVNGDQEQVDRFIEADPAVKHSVLVTNVRSWSPTVGVPSPSST